MFESSCAHGCVQEALRDLGRLDLVREGFLRKWHWSSEQTEQESLV